MSRLQHVLVEAMDLHRFSSVISAEEYEALNELVDRGARELGGRVVWNVNSTANGGGVAELLRPLLGYSRGGGVDARWVVVSGSPEFFDLTKRLHNHLHGFDGDGGGVGEAEQIIYEQTLAGAATELGELVRPQDIVILHDPQTAGLIPAARRSGATVIWRCHVGLDHPNRRSREAWSFLLPYVLEADAYVFSRATFAWEGLDQDKIAVIQPSIDAFSPKNMEQTPEQSLSILSRAGIVPHPTSGDATFTRLDGTPGRVDRRAEVVQVGPLTPEDRLVVQVSRWDTLKDPLGVLNVFAQHVAANCDAHLVLAGPSTESVADDPEGAGVFKSVREAWHALPGEVAGRVHLASLPMADNEENAVIVNALQRSAEVVVQKSLAEGFGLVVAEAMWKQRPVVASRIGGIQDQIVDGESGILVADPRDLAGFGSAIVGLFNDSERGRRIGQAARLRIRDHFLGPYHLAHYFELVQRLAGKSEDVGPTLTHPAATARVEEQR
jgi:trehalose synthase